MKIKRKGNLEFFVLPFFCSQIFEHLTHDPASPECLDILREYLVGKGDNLCFIECPYTLEFCACMAPEEFENGGFSLKTNQMSSVHTIVCVAHKLNPGIVLYRGLVCLSRCRLSTLLRRKNATITNRISVNGRPDQRNEAA